jgi:flagellin
MALSIATNTGALMAAASASSVNKDMETSMERLSTGKRINSASDDAAGVAIASRLTSEIKGTNQAIRNAQDAQGLINTAEGGHKEVENILQRMRELAVQASNDTNDVSDRTSLAAEMTSLTAEIDRIANATSWAGQELLDGATPDAAATTDDDSASFEFHVGARASPADSISVSIKAIGSTALGINGAGNVPESLTDITSDAEQAANTSKLTVDQAAGTLSFANTGAAGDDFDVKINGTTVSIELAVDDHTLTPEGVAQQMADAINAADISGVSVSRNAGVLTLNVGGGVDISSSDAAQASIGTIDSALKEINSQRAELGAVSNRLDNTVSNLTNVAINLEGGRGRIEDADFAAESTSLAKSQILQQASTAMLAQANASKQNVLSLLQG